MPTPADCARSLCRAARTLDDSPTKAQYEALGYTPASATIIRTFGGWNAAKETAGLETSHSRGSRVRPKPDDAPFTDDEWDELTVDQRWHYRNVEHNGQRTLERRAELRAWVRARKAESGCVRCGEDHPACLDYYHVDPDKKEMAIVEMTNNGYSREHIAREIPKCEVLCANCHRKEHDESTRELSHPLRYRAQSARLISAHELRRGGSRSASVARPATMSSSMG